MLERLLSISKFHCPKWQEIPNAGLLSAEVIDFVNSNLSPILSEEDHITKMMIQNYVKQGIVPKPAGRKYNRGQIAHLIVITSYKHVLRMENIHQGIELQVSLTGTENAYDHFASAIDEAVKHYFQPVINGGDLIFDEINLHEDNIGVVSIAHAFALRLLGNMILECGGYQNLRLIAEQVQIELMYS